MYVLVIPRFSFTQMYHYCRFIRTLSLLYVVYGQPIFGFIPLGSSLSLDSCCGPYLKKMLTNSIIPATVIYIPAAKAEGYYSFHVCYLRELQSNYINKYNISP